MIYVILLLILVFVYCTKFDKRGKPILYKNMHIEKLKHLDFDYFVEKVGDHRISVHRGKFNMVSTTMKEFYQQMVAGNDRDYLKSEDEYNLLSMLGIKDEIINEFGKLFDKNVKNIIGRDLGFWMGGKGTTTGWHTDIEDLNYLYLVRGKKRIMLISPMYNECMYEENITAFGARYSSIDFKNVDYDKYPKFKNVVIHTYILNEGDCIHIPKNWWHCVENLEDSIGVVYKIFRFNMLFTTLSEKIRNIVNVYIYRKPMNRVTITE